MKKGKNLRGRRCSNTSSVLYALRTAHSLSRKELAQQTGMSAREIGFFERGGRSMPMPKVIRLAWFFQVSVTCLLENDFDEMQEVLEE